jgi:hypothetical protein
VTRALPFVVAALALAQGCGKDCQSTCARVYEPAQCGVQVAGVDTDILRQDCVASCQTALTRPGDMNGYDPYEKVPPVSEWEDFSMRDDGNEKQAAEWMNCVWEMECEDLQLQAGICWPIGEG